MSTLKDRIYTVIFEAHTPAGKAFDVGLFFAIGLSVMNIMFESVPSLQGYAKWFSRIELLTTVLFSIEYLLRLWSSPKPLHYASSFYGLIDLLSILPFYLAIVLPGTGSLAILRSLRLLRIFRVLKLSRFLVEGNVLWTSLLRSSRKVGVFLFTVLLITIITGTLMYTIEGPENGFTSIPLSIYWSIVTLTTVGYGDIAPHTVLGQFLASVIMILGYAIIAVPTGIVSVELAQGEPGERGDKNRQPTLLPPTKTCENCGHSSHMNFHFCPECGTAFPNND